MPFGIRLGIDYGTSNTVVVFHTPGRPDRPLLFDGSPQLPSAVFADPAAGLLTGRDAIHAARTDSARVELNPKRRIDEDSVLLGESGVSVVDLIAATLRRVSQEGARVAGGACRDAVLTHPAAWGPRRREVLSRAAVAAGLPSPTLVPEPVAAAAYYVDVLGSQVPVGRCVVIYDFGAGTFDASVVRRVPEGFVVLATEGLPETGGLDVDAAVVAHLDTAYQRSDPALRDRLSHPDTVADRRARMLLWDDVRAAKELLSRVTSTFIHVPFVEAEIPLGREEFEQLARLILDRTVAATTRAVASTGVATGDISGIFLVGGSSRIPLAATLLHRQFGIAPTALDQPELVVAEGALRMTGERPAPMSASQPLRSSAPPPPPGPRPVGSPSKPVSPAGSPSRPVSPVGSAPPMAWRGSASVPARQPSMPAQQSTAPLPVYGYAPYPTFEEGVGSPGRVALVATLVTLLLLVGLGGGYLAWSQLRQPEPVGTNSPDPTGTAWATSSRPTASPTTPPARSPESSSTPSAAFPPEMAGVWVGEMVQSNQKTWQMTVVISGGSTTADVSYPAPLNCRGTLTVVDDHGDVLHLREHIDEGKCTPEGSVTLALGEDGQLHIEYVPDSGRYAATATLARSAP